MSKSTSNVVAFADPSIDKDPLTDLIRLGAKNLLSQALEVELEEQVAELQKHRLTDGRQAVIRNGDHPKCQIQTGIGPVTVQVPKIRSRDGKPVVFRLALVPPYVRKSRSLETVAGGDTVLSVFKRRVFRGDVRDIGRFSRSRGNRTIGKLCFTA